MSLRSKLLFTQSWASIVLLHVLGADTSNAENLWVVWMLHRMHITDFNAFAHSAKFGRFSKILNPDAHPTLVWHVRLCPFSTMCVPIAHVHLMRPWNTMCPLHSRSGVVRNQPKAFLGLEGSTNRVRRQSDITAPRTAAPPSADRPGSAPREPDKCAGWQWLPLTALPTNIVPYARQAIADLTSGKRVGLFGWS
jgi:hypothetical protein